MLPLLRYTLDLFTTPASAPAPSSPPAPVMASVQFRHPQANRDIGIDGVVVGYAFARSRRRTIGFSIGPEGLVVRAPRWTPLGEVERALQEKGRWILAKLREAHERRQRHASARIVWQDGALIPYLGASVQLVLDPGHALRERGVGLRGPQTSADAGAPSQLALGLAHSATGQQIRDAAQAWLMRQAEHNFLERLNHFAPLLGVRWTKMRLSNAGTRWGSASADGSVRLNWRLIHFHQPVIDYVVAHELSHLRVMNHSPQFWDTVASVVPDYATLRRQLKQDGIPLW